MFLYITSAITTFLCISIGGFCGSSFIFITDVIHYTFISSLNSPVSPHMISYQKLNISSYISQTEFYWKGQHQVRLQEMKIEKMRLFEAGLKEVGLSRTGITRDMSSHRQRIPSGFFDIKWYLDNYSLDTQRKLPYNKLRSFDYDRRVADLFPDLEKNTKLRDIYKNNFKSDREAIRKLFELERRNISILEMEDRDIFERNSDLIIYGFPFAVGFLLGASFTTLALTKNTSNIMLSANIFLI